LWDRVEDVLESVDLLDHAETFISRLSKGMRQRVGLAQALIHDPEVLILDEPTIGLDPAQILEVRELIGRLGQRHTILLSTHILSEVEQICNRVIMIIEGRIWTDMSMADVSGLGGQDKVSLKLAKSDSNTDTALADVSGVKSVNRHDDGIYGLELDGRDETRAQIAQLAVDSGWGLLEMANVQVGLEAIFLDKLREAERAEGATYETQNILIVGDEARLQANEIPSEDES
jgi:ABC-2 type transport system ATP-binding protein